MPGAVPPLLQGLVLAADAPAGSAPAGDTTAPEGGGLLSMLPVFAIIFFIFYFLVIRPQGKERRKREDLIKQIKKHDRVVTTAGIHGVVVSAGEGEVVLEVADGVRIKFDRSAVWQVRREGEAAEAASEAAAAAAKTPEPSGKGKGKS